MQKNFKMSSRRHIWLSTISEGCGKMKRILKGLLLACSVIGLTGCGIDDNANIYATSYPIEYLTEVLYGNHASITSIYPDGTNIEEYTLTEKQVEDYSNGTIFVYNGTTNETQIARNLVNENKNLKVIDAAYSLRYNYGPEELWLSPSNYLMLATNIKDNLEDQIGTKYINEEIEDNYDTLEEDLSIMDANIRAIAKDAKDHGHSTIVASTSVFKFLEDYGFTVISLEEYQLSSASLTTLQNNFKSGTYKYLLVENTETTNDLINQITNNGGEAVVVNMMNTLTEEDRKNNETYFTIMNDFITDLRTITNY